MSTQHKYALIMAGGSGTRLWPMSREANPKQFQPLLGKQSPFQHMLELTKSVVPIERILVMATANFREQVFQQAPELLAENFLFEPSRRDTGPAITLALLQIEARDREAQVCILWSDHRIENSEAFSSSIGAAFQANSAQPDCMVIVGANPSRPDTGFGYIEMDDEVATYEGVKVFNAKQFIEKPDLATAKKFVSRWEYLWNVGYSVVTISEFFASLAICQPELQKTVRLLKSQLHDQHKAATTYEKFPKISIDYLYTQKQKRLLVVPADMGWSDIGSWQILHEVVSETTGQDVVTQGEVVTLDTHNSLVYAKDRPITVVGASNLVVVDTGDVILVLDKNTDASRMKELVAKLKETNPNLL